jgi:hypothetical protein
MLSISHPVALSVLELFFISLDTGNKKLPQEVPTSLWREFFETFNCAEVLPCIIKALSIQFKCKSSRILIAELRDKPAEEQQRIFLDKYPLIEN